MSQSFGERLRAQFQCERPDENFESTFALAFNSIHKLVTTDLEFSDPLVRLAFQELNPEMMLKYQEKMGLAASYEVELGTTEE